MFPFFFGSVNQEVLTVFKYNATSCLFVSPQHLWLSMTVCFASFWSLYKSEVATICTSCPFLMPLSKFNYIAQGSTRRNRVGSVALGDLAPSSTKLQCWSCLSFLDFINHILHKIDFLSNILREERNFDYKKAIADSILMLIHEIPNTKESGFSHLCKFIEDYEFTHLSI